MSEQEWFGKDPTVLDTLCDGITALWLGNTISVRVYKLLGTKVVHFRRSALIKSILGRAGGHGPSFPGVCATITLLRTPTWTPNNNVVRNCWNLLKLLGDIWAIKTSPSNRTSAWRSYLHHPWVLRWWEGGSGHHSTVILNLTTSGTEVVRTRKCC